MSNSRAVRGKASLEAGRAPTSGVKRWHPNHSVETLSKENHPTPTAPLRAKRQKLCGRTPPSKVRTMSGIEWHYLFGVSCCRQFPVSYSYALNQKPVRQRNFQWGFSLEILLTTPT